MAWLNEVDNIAILVLWRDREKLYWYVCAEFKCQHEFIKEIICDVVLSPKQEGNFHTFRINFARDKH